MVVPTLFLDTAEVTSRGVLIHAMSYTGTRARAHTHTHTHTQSHRDRGGRKARVLGML